MDDENCNYGSPGEIAECLTLLPDPPAGCVRCSTSSAPTPWSLGVLGGLLALAGLRRRKV